MAKVYKPPKSVPENVGGWFLAGSIEMGKAENWQKRMEEVLLKHDINVFNPRRDDWDSSWVQTIHNNHFKEQVEWELEMLERSDFIILYLSPGTKSPISLLELGLFAFHDNLLVCCPEGFWRKGNVDIVCNRYSIPLFESLDELISYISSKNPKQMIDDKIFGLFKSRCVVCLKKAVCIHEIIPKSRDPNWMREENRVPLCHECHNIVHSDGTANWEDRLIEFRQKRLVQFHGRI